MTAFSELWYEYRTRLRGYIAKRVRNDSAVDDLLQEVFLKAHEGLPALRSSGSITAWLYRIAANTIVDYYRGQKSWEELPDELAAPEPEHDHVRELAACLQPFIATLPEAYRTALILSEIDGLPQKEVARRLGVSYSGAKSRVQRGREKLRQSLLDCCDIEIRQCGIVGYEPRDKSCKCD